MLMYFLPAFSFLMIIYPKKLFQESLEIIVKQSARFKKNAKLFLP